MNMPWTRLPHPTLARRVLLLFGVMLCLGAPAQQGSKPPAPPKPRFVANYDEGKVGTFTLPDPLKMKNGTVVTTAEQWRRQRRTEVLRTVEEVMYGRGPRRVTDLTFKVTQVKTDALGGRATRKMVHIALASHPAWAGMDLMIYIPNDAKKPVPVFLGLSFGGNQAVSPEKDIPFPRHYEMLTRKYPNPEDSRGKEASRWPLELILNRGYALATAWYGDIEPDRLGGWKDGVRGALAADFRHVKRDVEKDWSAIGAWAWGLSRALDYLQTDKDVNARQVAVVGHSRLGKTALWAGASDERFAITISNDSGEGGAAITRRHFGETIGSMSVAFPFWFCARHWDYVNRENELPMDSHTIVSLVAPRPVYIASASEDQWADPKGEFLGGKHAEPVYALFGKKGLGVDVPPVADLSVGDFIAYHLRTGKHDITTFDWTQYLNFAERHFTGRKTPAYNSDEAKAGGDDLPDPLKMNDGTPVRTAEDWRTKRRPEILRMFQQEEYGRPPQKLTDVKFKVTSVKTDALGGKATRKIVHIWLERHPSWCGADLALYIPNGAPKPVPAFLGLNFKGNHAITTETDIQTPPNWMPMPSIGTTAQAEETRGREASRWPLERILARGYAVGTMWYGAMEPDSPEGFAKGVRQALTQEGPEDGWDVRQDWGTIGAWAWGLSRGLDYMETDPDIDAKKVAVIGHSRLGKTALWAGALDERFALTISNNSGEGGASLARRYFGELIISTRYTVPYWYCARHYTWTGREHERPFDQHMLIALAAPRPVYVASATEDLGADPKGEFLAAKGAESVYALFGKKGLREIQWPPTPDTSVGECVGYHLRTGKHDLTAADWDHYMSFADRHYGRK